MPGVLPSLVLLVVAAFVAGITGFNLLTFAVAFRRRPRPPRVVVAFVREMLASFALIPFWPLFALIGARYEARSFEEAGRGDREAGEAPRRPPVVLLHGYLMNRTNWLWLGWVLARRGIGPLVGLSYLTVQGTPWGARRLGRFVEALCQREGVERVDIVAHSMGGLVARHYIEQLGGAARVRRLITIATPHRGTAWAKVALGKARVDLAPPVSESHCAPPDGVLYTSIWSRCDNMVVPPESAQLTPRPPEEGEAHAAGAGGGDQLDDVVFDDLGHLSLLISPRVADAVATRLAAPLSPPRAS